MTDHRSEPVWFETGWDDPQLTEDEMRLRNAFEWWYFDFQDEASGVALVVVFGRKNPVLSRTRCSLFLELTEPGRSLRRVRTYADGSFRRSSADRLEVAVGPHSFTLRGEDPGDLRYQVAVRLDGLSIDLDLVPAHRGFLPSADGSYFRNRRDAAQRTCVSFSAPIMRGQGRLERAGRPPTPLAGRGYHDHPWGTTQLFQSSARWSWSRAFDGHTGTMFARVEPQPDYRGELAFFYQAQEGRFDPELDPGFVLEVDDWARASWYGIRFPHRVSVEANGAIWDARVTGSLLDTPMYERSKISWGPAGTNEDASGSGWLEYYRVPQRWIWLVFLAARIGAFFWRPFPWFGR